MLCIVFIDLSKNVLTNRWKMDEIDEEADPREQIFHNNVREQIVSI